MEYNVRLKPAQALQGAEHHALGLMASATTANRPQTETDEPVLNRSRHVQYHLRCLKTFLPTYYTGNDSNRMLFAFFTLNALDLLGVLDSSISDDQRAGYIDWLYNCQLPSGGFRGFPGTKTGDDQSPSTNAHWDVANIAGTFFALEALVILGDDLGRVNVKKTLAWVASLQRANGSFGELVGIDGRPSGDADLRYCHMAAAIRYILGQATSHGGVDVDVDRLAKFVLASQSYDGGFARAPFLESHAGETYCALGTLILLGRLPQDVTKTRKPGEMPLGSFNVSDRLIHWLVSRQTVAPPDDKDDEDGFDSGVEASRDMETASSEERWVGFNGRCNKPPDTCYSFWAVASLEMVGGRALINAQANRQFLLDRTQHRIGGFSKVEGDPPDILHSSLGLAALSLLQEPGLKALDPVFCISRAARERLDTVRSSFGNA